MSIFGQMESDWRDQQSGARDQQYDEEEVQQLEDGAHHPLETASPLAERLLLPTADERIHSEGSASGERASDRGSEDYDGWSRGKGGRIAGGDREKKAA